MSGIAIAEEAQADMVLTGKLLAKGRTVNVTLHVTDVPTTRLVGVLTGRIRRDKIKDESEKAKKVAADIKRKIDILEISAFNSLPPLVAEEDCHETDRSGCYSHLDAAKWNFDHL